MQTTTRDDLISNLAVPERILSEFFKSSSVGLALFDRELRYRGLNPCLAHYHRLAPEAHLGKQIYEILGAIIAPAVERVIKQVFATGHPILNYEVAGPLPTRPHGAYWIGNAFPVTDSSGQPELVGAVVVELKPDFVIQTLDTMPSSQVMLRSWKDIARYLGTCVKTVQRWERKHNLPVRRVLPSRGAVVFALKDELDDWLRSCDVPQKNAI